MPPPVHVCKGLTSPADAAYPMYCKFVKPFATVRGLTSIRIFCRVLLPCRRYNFVQNVTSSSVGGSDYLSQISPKSVQYSSEAKKKLGEIRGIAMTGPSSAGHNKKLLIPANRLNHTGYFT